MIPSALVPAANHLWQSTLFAFVAGLLTLFLRNNRAHVRYWLWLTASVKFLLPFSILVAVGGLIGRQTAAAVPPSRLVPTADFSSFVEQVGAPFTTTVPRFAMLAVQHSYPSVIALVLIFVWATGFVTLVYRWTANWRRMRASLRQASPMDLPIGLPVKSSPAFGEPGVFGIFRPVLLLPDKIVDCLTAREMESIIAHELCHVRRRDNLATAIHMAVEVVFWFHPLVWWLGQRLMEEREQACDEEVLRNGGEPSVYAEGILKICELYLASPLPCVAGVTGGDLKKRIEAIMSNRMAIRLNYAKKAVLAVAAMAAVVMPIVVGIANTPMIHAKPQPSTVDAPSVRVSSQKPIGVFPRPDGTLMTPQVVTQSASVTTPKFEAASVKPCDGPLPPGGRSGGGSVSPGRLTIDCQTVKSLITTAYVLFADGHHQPSSSLKLFPVEGGPSWISSERYSVNAEAEDAVSPEVTQGPMLQALLEDRFKLKIHRETKEVPIYAMTTAKSGVKLKQAEDGSCTLRDLTKGPTPRLQPGQKPYCGSASLLSRKGSTFIWEMHAMSLDEFAKWLNLGLDRLVFDKTGVTGKFNFHLEFAPDDSTPGMVAGSTDTGDATAPSIFGALQRQLGLKLEPTKGPGEFFIIDHVEKPTGN